MSPCGRALHTSRGAMAMLARKFPRTRLPVGASALCVVVLCWLYVFPVYRLPNEKEIVQGVLAQRTAWRRNQTSARLFRYLLLAAARHQYPSCYCAKDRVLCEASLSCALCAVPNLDRDLSQGLCLIPHAKRCFKAPLRNQRFVI